MASSRVLALALLFAVIAAAITASSSAASSSEGPSSDQDQVGNTDDDGLSSTMDAADALSPAISAAVEAPVGGPVSSDALENMAKSAAQHGADLMNSSGTSALKACAVAGVVAAAASLVF